jgi:protease I
MSKSLQGLKIALLVANGFDQNDFTDVQKALIAANASVKVISPDQGLVNGWEGQGWGHHFPVDQVLSTALGADYDMLVVPGGSRSLEKLKTTAHTKRFVNSFINAEKPVAMLCDAVDMLAYAGQDTDVAAYPNIYVADTKAEGADRAAIVSEMIAFLAQSNEDMKQAA